MPATPGDNESAYQLVDLLDWPVPAGQKRWAQRLGAGSLGWKGVKIYVYSGDEHLSKAVRSNHGWQIYAVGWWCEQLRSAEDGHWVDVGGNLGSYAVPIACCLRGGVCGGAPGSLPSRRVVTAEMDPVNRRVLEANARLNGLDNMLIYPFAVGSPGEVGPIRVAKMWPTNAGAHRVGAGKFKNDANVTTAQLTTFDKMLESAPAVMGAALGMVLDVETHELQAIQGATKFFRESPPCWLQVEMPINRQRHTFYDQALEAFGYSRKKMPVSAGVTDAMYVQQDLPGCIARTVRRAKDLRSQWEMEAGGAAQTGSALAPAAPAVGPSGSDAMAPQASGAPPVSTEASAATAGSAAAAAAAPVPGRAPAKRGDPDHPAPDPFAMMLPTPGDNESDYQLVDMLNWPGKAQQKKWEKRFGAGSVGWQGVRLYVFSFAEKISGALRGAHGWQIQAVGWWCEKMRSAADGHFVDVGGNLGSYAVPIACCLRGGVCGGAPASVPSRRLVTAELDPVNRRVLEANARVNGLDNMVIFPFAVGSPTEVGPIRVQKRWADNSGAHRVGGKLKGAPDSEASTFTTAQLTTFDNMLASVPAVMGAVLGMVLDVETHELAAIQGATRFFQESPPCWIQMEMPIAKGKWALYDKMLAPFGYGNWTRMPVGAGVLDAMYVQKDLPGCINRTVQRAKELRARFGDALPRRVQAEEADLSRGALRRLAAAGGGVDTRPPGRGQPGQAGSASAPEAGVADTDAASSLVVSAGSG